MLEVCLEAKNDVKVIWPQYYYSFFSLAQASLSVFYNYLQLDEKKPPNILK